MKKAEQLELERLEKMKEACIYEMMGKCELINDMIKDVKNGSWFKRVKAHAKIEGKENE